jgi:hypothetical protein
MTNIFSTPAKRANRNGLFAAAVETLEKEGYKVERIARIGKSSVRRITMNGVSKIVSIRTSQDKWIAFPRNEKNDGWGTLEGVDMVVAASVDDQHNPRFANIHLIPGDEMRTRFDRAYEARKKAGYALPDRRGIWISLYEPEANDPVNRVGAGAGLKHPPVAQVPLIPGSAVHTAEVEEPGDGAGADTTPAAAPVVEQPLTIPEAKRRLALTIGCDPTDINITVNS